MGDSAGQGNVWRGVRDGNGGDRDTKGETDYWPHAKLTPKGIGGEEGREKEVRRERKNKENYKTFQKTFKKIIELGTFFVCHKHMGTKIRAQGAFAVLQFLAPPSQFI